MNQTKSNISGTPFDSGKGWKCPICGKSMDIDHQGRRINATRMPWVLEKDLQQEKCPLMRINVDSELERTRQWWDRVWAHYGAVKDRFRVQQEGNSLHLSEPSPGIGLPLVDNLLACGRQDCIERVKDATCGKKLHTLAFKKKKEANGKPIVVPQKRRFESIDEALKKILSGRNPQKP